LLLGAAVTVLFGRKLLTLRRAVDQGRLLPGAGLWRVLRHAEFRIASARAWALVSGTARADRSAPPAVGAAVRADLERNVVFRWLFGRSPRWAALGAELADLNEQAERLGLIGCELSPDAYLREALADRWQRAGISARTQDALLRDLWEQPQWQKEIARLQAAVAGQAGDAARPRVQRHLRRLLSLLLAQLGQPGASAEYQDAVLAALAAFATEQPVRVYIARLVGNTLDYHEYWLPALVLEHRLLRGQLTSAFAVYDDSRRRLEPADPVTRTLAGSA
jgi:hypothetical protein